MRLRGGVSYGVSVQIGSTHEAADSKAVEWLSRLSRRRMAVLSRRLRLYNSLGHAARSTSARRLYSPVRPARHQVGAADRRSPRPRRDCVGAVESGRADPNRHGGTLSPFGLLGADKPLYAAVSKGNADVAAALLEAGADAHALRHVVLFGMIAIETPLGDAAFRGHAPFAAYLLAAGADPDGPGIALGPLGLILAISPLGFAAAKGHAEVVNALLRAGAAPNGRGTTIGPFALFSSAPPL